MNPQLMLGRILIYKTTWFKFIKTPEPQAHIKGILSMSKNKNLKIRSTSVVAFSIRTHTKVALLPLALQLHPILEQNYCKYAETLTFWHF